MRKINWIVRIKNKAFWVALIPAILLLIQAIAAVFGLNINLGDLGDKLLTVINALFAVLAILGVVVDPDRHLAQEIQRGHLHISRFWKSSKQALFYCATSHGKEARYERTERIWKNSSRGTGKSI